MPSALGSCRGCFPRTGEDVGGRGRGLCSWAVREAWIPAPRLLWTHPEMGRFVTGSRILLVTVIYNTVGGLYLYWTEEEPSVGWLCSFFAHFLHTSAVSQEQSQCLFQGTVCPSSLLKSFGGKRRHRGGGGRREQEKPGKCFVPMKGLGCLWRKRI